MRIARGKLGLLAWAATVAVVAPASALLSERAAAIDTPQVGTPVQAAEPILVGRGRIAPAAGTRVYPLLAQGIPCGLLVDGDARWEYRVEDRFSRPVALRNFKRASGLEPTQAEGALVVAESLTGAVIWGWGLAPDAPGSAAAPARAASAAPVFAAGWAANILSDRRFPPPSHGLLRAVANGAPGLRYALLRTHRQQLLLHVDPGAQEEALYLLRRSNDPGSTFKQGVGLVELAAQPIGREWWASPPAALIAEHESLQVTNTGGTQLRLLARVTLRSQRPGIALWNPSLVDKIYDDVGRAHRVTLIAAKVDGRSADFLHGDDDLLVSLGRTLAKDDQVEVEIAYEGELAQRPKGNSYWVLGTWPWYPREDLGGEKATLDLDLDVPAPLVPFGSGAETSRTSTGERRHLVTRIDRPAQFAVLGAGKYAIVEETREEVTCRVLGYAMLDEKAARHLIDKFFSARRLLEQMLDEPYPFRGLSIVELASWGLGQAPPGLIFYTHEFFTAPVDRRTRGYFQDLDVRFIHEIAHGWWGHVGKMRSVEEAWISEAFADYVAALGVWRLKGEARGGHEFSEMVERWRRDADQIAPGGSLYLADHLAGTDARTSDDYWRLHYGKGPLVVHAIRLELQRQKGSAAEGDRYFIALLRSFLHQHRYDWATTPGLVAALSELTGTDWQPFFERYVYGTETPKLAG